ncbi:MAG: hypothetical protein Q7S33_02375 [Nanoarchaeota archaeon]|nr:hypothetical protein [Nanoarchaeota archaeon]
MSRMLVLIMVALFATCVFNGCGESKYIYGVVLNEYGTIVKRQNFIERSEGALFGNDSIKLNDPTYVIQFQVVSVRSSKKIYDSGPYLGKIYTFQIMGGRYNNLEALNIAIHKGTKIRIPQSEFNFYLNGNVGKIFDSNVSVLDE